MKSQSSFPVNLKKVLSHMRRQLYNFDAKYEYGCVYIYIGIPEKQTTKINITLEPWYDFIH
jgi:hypothetical protein